MNEFSLRRPEMNQQANNRRPGGCAGRDSRRRMSGLWGRGSDSGRARDRSVDVREVPLSLWAGTGPGLDYLVLVEWVPLKANNKSLAPTLTKTRRSLSA